MGSLTIWLLNRRLEVSRSHIDIKRATVELLLFMKHLSEILNQGSLYLQEKNKSVR